jgi:hypothetical protein
MPLIYHRNLNLFIYDPTDNLAEEESQNPAPQPVPPPAPKKSSNRNVCQYPKLPDRAPAKSNPNQSSLWQISRLEILMTVVGWLGIAIYYHYNPFSFSLVGVFLFLCCDVLALFLLHLLLVLSDLYFDTRMRKYCITLRFFSYNHEILRDSPLAADFHGRGIFFRELKGRLIRQFPFLKRFFQEPFNYENIPSSTPNCGEQVFFRLKNL